MRACKEIGISLPEFLFELNNYLVYNHQMQVIVVKHISFISVPYVLLPILQNLSGNPKCSLLIAKDPEDRTDTVITIYGDAVPVIPSLPCLSTLISCLSLLHFASDIFLNA